VGALESKFFTRLCDLLGQPDLAPRQFDPSSQAEIAGALTETFATKPLAEWLELFDGEDVSVGPVGTLAEAAVEFGQV
jgi:alpha-methylacyl-CoA racemase